MGILQEVDQHLNDQHEIHRHERQIRSDVGLDTALLDCRAELFQRGSDDILNVASIFPDLQDPGFEAAQIQQVSQEAVQAFCLLPRGVNQVSMNRVGCGNLLLL